MEALVISVSVAGESGLRVVLRIPQLPEFEPFLQLFNLLPQEGPCEFIFKVDHPLVLKILGLEKLHDFSEADYFFEGCHLAEALVIYVEVFLKVHHLLDLQVLIELLLSLQLLQLCVQTQHELLVEQLFESIVDQHIFLGHMPYFLTLR
eukprot:CAMPEP_0170545240 /NCGR_PEP_ID=MMETSP0211-20121228/3702_1 /TAXON_ID=311385 /ORGANISM="Pseudokeronopsis sp., Strain OXSARD2" /LENGTH=148 /DNA_ID=CAMNT_0010849093 /DNA_START=960 /DNA_END=1406 /DNA_ORIENTATION=+